jgi:hypothetical protein
MLNVLRKFLEDSVSCVGRRAVRIPPSLTLWRMSPDIVFGDCGACLERAKVFLARQKFASRVYVYLVLLIENLHKNSSLR